MAEGAGVYFEDHEESRDLGRLALRGGVTSSRCNNAAPRIAAVVILLKYVGLGSLWMRPLRRAVLGGPGQDS